MAPVSRNGKWITDLHAMTPLADAARRVLTARLKVVHDYLPLALHHWKDDSENVHQLRVGTRRGGAALDIFEPCLPERIFADIGKQLRKIRRAAGAARDWDVFSEALVERERHVTPAQRPGLDFLMGTAHTQRIEAQTRLERAGDGAPSDFQQLAASTIAAIREPNGRRSPKTLGDLAGPWLTDILTTMHDDVTNGVEQYEQLHQVRILGKRLRYGMEVFASCFNDEFKDRYYPLVEEMQDILGLANDSHVASQRLTALRDVLRPSQPKMWKRFRAGIEGLLRYHQSRLTEQRRRFLKWWTAWQGTGAQASLMAMIQTTTVSAVAVFR